MVPKIKFLFWFCSYQCLEIVENLVTRKNKTRNHQYVHVLLKIINFFVLLQPLTWNFTLQAILIVVPFLCTFHTTGNHALSNRLHRIFFLEMYFLPELKTLPLIVIRTLKFLSISRIN